MTNPFRVHSNGQYRYDNGLLGYVVTGYDIRRFEGTSTASETVGRPIHPTELTAWGTPIETLWTTKEEAAFAAVRVNDGNEAGISFSSYSND